MSASSSGDTADFAGMMGPVARTIMGETNPVLSSNTELRFGTSGSLSVDLTGGIWFDYEANKGGGVIDFVRKKKGTDQAGAVQWLKDQSLWPKDERASHASKPRIVATYNYTEAAGKLRFQVVRYEPKTFRQRSPDPSEPDGWKWSTKGLQLMLYRLPQILAAVAAVRTIYIVEGEKSADALAALGLAATCSPAGAGKWKSHYGEALAGADVVILPDNDPPGQDHAADVAKHLQSIAASVRLVMLPDLPPKGDVVDWLEARGTREALEAMETTEAITPPHDAAKEQTAGEAQPEAQPKPMAGTADYEAGIRAVVDRFNKKFMMVNEAGKAAVFQPGYDPVLRRRRFDRLTLRDLQALYMNETVAVGENEQKRVVRKPVAHVWLHHQDRRQYVDGVTFDPATTEPIPGVLNLWQGFAVKPARGDWSLMRSHIQTIICGGDEDHFKYLMGWMARMFQRPAEQGEVAVVMKGGEGTGKGTLAKALMQLVGLHALAVSNSKHLVGNFNAHLRDAIYLFADEAFFAGDRAAIGVLKSLITEPWLMLEGKFQNATQAPNYLHVMMASNEDWVVPASLDARRFFVLEVSEDRKNDLAYFVAIWKQMNAGGFEAMLHDLLQRDLTTPSTSAPYPQPRGYSASVS
jgi:hypothetical protein